MGFKVSLRDVQESDLHIFYEHQREPEATHVAAFPARDYKSFMTHWKKGMGEATTILQTIVVQEEVAGNIVCWEQAGECNIGYWLGKKYWGNGIASAALSLFLKQVIKRPLFAHVAKHNTGSIRALEKNGFSKSTESTSANLNSEHDEEYIMILT